MNQSLSSTAASPHAAASPWNAPFLLKVAFLGLLLLLPIPLRAWLQRGPAEMPIVVRSEDLHLGTLWAGTATRRTMTLENTSDREIGLSSVRTSCGCVDLAAESVLLAPGESREVELLVDVPARRMLVDDSESTLFTSLLRLEAEGLEGMLPPLQMRGTIRTLLTPEMSVVRFEEPLIAGQPFPEQTVRITAAEPLTSLEPVAEDVPAALRIESIDAETYSLAIRLHDDLPPGAVRFDVPVRAELSGGETLELQLLRVLGRVLPEVAPIPAEVQWGVVPAGRTARAEVVLRSMTGTAFEVTGITVEPAEETIRFEVHEAGEGKVVVIEASVQDDRRVEATVHVETTGPEGRAGVTPIAVSYQGVGAPEE